MHNIYDCVDTFTSLLDTEYRLILGRKGVSVTLNISFDKKDCFHLMGLQYLTFCRSFFPESSRDYTKNQASWTLLYKEKIKHSQNQTIVLYDRVKK